jgi:hypothetical protein
LERGAGIVVEVGAGALLAVVDVGGAAPLREVVADVADEACAWLGDGLQPPRTTSEIITAASA